MCGNSAWLWKTMPMFRRFTGTRVTSCPPISMRPASGITSPAIALSVVVLPQPDGPRSVTNCPAAISSVTSSTARWAPNALTTPSSRTVPTPQPPSTRFSPTSRSRAIAEPSDTNTIIEAMAVIDGSKLYST